MEDSSSILKYWKLTVEYDGTAYVGWQRQDEGDSIQAAIEYAASQLFSEPVVATASGRTDAGVHATNQVVSIAVHTDRVSRSVWKGMNTHLPPDIAVVKAEPMTSRFHARFDSCGKRYEYRFHDGASRSPLIRQRVWHHHQRLDCDLMQEAANALVGEHDFSSFRAAGCGATTAVRTVHAIRIVRTGDLVCMEVEGRGFLRHMVRVIAGTLVQVGLGRIPVSSVAGILAERDRACAGPTAPAQGLTLTRVLY